MDARATFDPGRTVEFRPTRASGRMSPLTRGCCTKPWRGRWIVSKGGLRDRPSPRSREVHPSRPRHSEPLWRPSPRPSSNSSKAAFCNSLSESRRETEVGLNSAITAAEGLRSTPYFFLGKRASNRLLPWVTPVWLVCEGHLLEGPLASARRFVLFAGCSRDRGSGRAQAE
jgi:hypothetical protein